MSSIIAKENHWTHISQKKCCHVTEPKCVGFGRLHVLLLTQSIWLTRS